MAQRYNLQRTELPSLSLLVVAMAALLVSGHTGHAQQLEDVHVTRDTMRLRYHPPNGEGVEVKSDANIYVSVSSTLGETLLNITRMSSNSLVISIFNSDYIITKIQNYRSSRAEERVYQLSLPWKKIIQHAQAKKISSVSLKRFLKTPSPQRIGQDLEKLLHRTEISMLKDLTMELGRRGLSGRDSKAAMAVYVLAMRLNSHTPQYKVNSDCYKLHRTAKERLSKLETAKPKLDGKRCPYVNTMLSSFTLAVCKTCPRGRGCLGLCGPKCECWSMLCGDCCYYRGCAGQDHCCTGKGKGGALTHLSFNCFNVFGFNCEMPNAC